MKVLHGLHGSYCDGSNPLQNSNPDEASQIDDDIANWLRAANEKVAVGGPFERFRPVDDRARN